jgi:release factor glutamine methyltransferase
LNLSYAGLRSDLAKALGAFLEPEEAWAESWRWFEEGLGWDRVRLAARGEEPVPAELRERVGQWLRLRREGEPWAYLVGWTHFRGRRFEVTRDTLIPRPETELLVEAALELGRRHGFSRAVDVGTGSGIIAVSLVLEHRWAITATDLSPGALAVAKRNAKALAAPITFMHGDLLAPVPDPLGLVVSNPPYVDVDDKPTLQRELSFEPAMALFSGDHGLRHPTELLRQAKERGAPACALEIGAGQGAELRRRALESGWAKVELRVDWAGHDRVLIAEG